MNTIATHWTKALGALLLVTGLLGLTSTSFAQGLVEKYKLEEIGVKFASIVSTKGATYVGAGDDNSYKVSLPFDFNYDNVDYKSGSAISVNTNGWLEFASSAQPPGSPWDDRVYPNYKYPSTIYGFSYDLWVLGGIYTATTGASPNRTFIVEYNTFIGYDPYQEGPQATMQIRLSESSNVVEIHYQQPGQEMWAYASVGLHGNNPFTYLRAYGQDLYIPSNSFRFTPPLAAKPQLSTTPKSINFGQWLAGQTSATVAVTVKNSSTNGTLVVTGASISGPSDFMVMSVPASNTYLPGQTGTYLLAFSPQASGNRTASFNIVSNGVDSGSQQIALSGFGIAPQVQYEEPTAWFRKTRTKLGESLSYSTVIKSTGNGPLTFLGAEITGEYANNYKVTRMPATLIPAGTWDTLTVTYSPLEEGLRTATLTMRTNSLQGPNKTVTLYGTGILPHLSLTPSVVRFDSVAMGDTAYATVRLSNIGSDTVAIKSNILAYADPDFTYVGLTGSDSLIAPEKFRDVQIRFIPLTRGHREARVKIMTNIPKTFEDVRRDTSEFTLEISGTAVPYGLLSVEGAAKLDSAIVGTQVCQTVKLWNNGESSLTVTAASIEGTNASDFSLLGAVPPITIAPESFVEVQLCGTPSARGLRTAMVMVEGLSGEKIIAAQYPIAVFGLEVCAQPDMATAFGGEIVRVNTSKTATITITNCGDVASEYTAVVAGAKYALVGSATSGLIQPNGTTSYTVSFNPAQMTLHAGTLTISAEGMTPIVVDLAGTGGNSQLVATGTDAPATEIGSSNTFDVTVTNNGNMDWTVGATTVQTGEFTNDNAPTSIAANGGTGTFAFTFRPVSGGSGMANVTFPTSDNTGFSFMIHGVTASVRQTAANGYVLGQNYPNPVNGASTIDFTMAEAGHVTIVLIDMSGNTVATLADEFYGAGVNEAKIDLSNLASGTYFYEFVANGVRLQRSMIVAK